MLSHRNPNRTGTEGDWMGLSRDILVSVVGDLLTSTDGVRWRQRRFLTATGNRASAVDQRTATSPSQTSPLVLKLNCDRKHAVPTYADMEPEKLYKVPVAVRSFCDLVYRDDKVGPEGQLVCIRVSLEAKDKETVTASAFTLFCELMGLEPPAAAKERIEYVYCPAPALAEHAQVTIADEVGIDSYSVWYMKEDDF